MNHEILRTNIRGKYVATRVENWYLKLASQQELRGHLETCLMEGTTLVVTDVDVNELEYDSRFYYILRSRYRFLTSSTPFKLMVSYT